MNEGTFGVVFKAIRASEKANYDDCMARGTVYPHFFAIKKPKNNAREGEGFNKDAVREIALLMELKRGTGVDALLLAAAERGKLALCARCTCGLPAIFAYLHQNVAARDMHVAVWLTRWGFAPYRAPKHSDIARRDSVSGWRGPRSLPCL